MKFSAITMVVAISLLLLLTTIFVVMGAEFRWIFYITFIGQIMIVIMIYKVLTDDYTTNKTFDDFYEDHSISNDK